MKKLDEMRARLAAATPWPWDCDGFADGDVVNLSIYEGTNQGRVIAADITTHGDADLLRYAPTDMGKLISAIEAGLAACNAVIDNTDGHKPPGPPHPTQQQATAVRIRAALTAALETT